MTNSQPDKSQSQMTVQRTRAVMTLALACIAIPALGTSPASARIKCNNGYQIVAGSQIATPYCQDQLLARVAREYGTRVSANAIRSNPMRKREVCRLVGEDIRVQSTCHTVLPRRGGRF